jgi:hypothetical protein
VRVKRGANTSIQVWPRVQDIEADIEAEAHGELTHTLVLLGDGTGNVNKNLPLLLALLISN